VIYETGTWADDFRALGEPSASQSPLHDLIGTFGCGEQPVGGALGLERGDQGAGYALPTVNRDHPQEPVAVQESIEKREA
jgi:hypothetical protein